MSELYSLQPPELTALLKGPLFRHALADIITHADETEASAGFVVFGVAGELALSRTVHHHTLHSLTQTTGRKVRPELVATVHAHPPGENNQLPTLEDLKEHCVTDSFAPGLVSVVAARPEPGAPAALTFVRAEPELTGRLGCWYLNCVTEPGQAELETAMDLTHLRRADALFRPELSRFTYYPAPEVFVPQLYGAAPTPQ